MSRYPSTESLCERILSGDPGALWAAAPYTPERGDFVSLWKRFGTELHVAPSLEEVLALCPPEMQPERFCLCLAVFREAGLLHSSDGRVYSSRYIRQSTKVNLDATAIMRRLRRGTDNG